jgi:hypothetical protein
MTAPQAAPELSTASRPEEVVFVAECPYSPDRPQAVIWMNGYRAALAARATPGQELTAVKDAIRDYHYALDTRQHGGVAQDRAFNAICQAMGMHWTQGAELAGRPTPTVKQSLTVAPEKASKT